jgi:cellulose synthase/poly-beta-1,6-N-acetylglucosamine synthase-like glycosyltransferase
MQQQRVAEQYPALVQSHIDSLPDGWLGKNHALQKGAEQAAGEYILFTDADVVFEPRTVRRAVAHAIEQQIDHLTVLPQIQMPSLLLESFVVKFARFFLLYFKPWKAPDQNSSAYLGIGAFNLVRAEAYRDAGLHEPIRMRPDDDVQLGN